MKGNTRYCANAARLPRAQGPSRPLLLHNMSANRPRKAPKSPKISSHGPLIAPNRKQTISWARWLKMRFPGHLVHPQPPTFATFHPTRRPPYLGQVGYGKRQEVAQRGGCQKGSTRSTGCNKMTFCKNDPRQHGVPKQVFWARFELVVARFGPPKIPKCLQNGGFLEGKNGAKMGQKYVFGKLISDQLACTNKSNAPFLSALQGILGALESQNAMKMGWSGTKNQSKRIPKFVFPTILLDYLGCTNKWNEPILNPC